MIQVIIKKVNKILRIILTVVLVGCSPPSEDTIKKNIDQNLPIGSTVTQVEEFLKKNDEYEYSKLYINYENKKTIDAISKKSYGLMDGRVRIVFQFSNNNLLSSYSVYISYTWL